MDAFRALFEERFGGEDVAALTRGMSAEELAAMPPFPFPKFLFPKGTFPDGLRFDESSFTAPPKVKAFVEEHGEDALAALASELAAKAAKNRGGGGETLTRGGLSEEEELRAFIMDAMKDELDGLQFPEGEDMDEAMARLMESMQDFAGGINGLGRDYGDSSDDEDGRIRLRLTELRLAELWFPAFWRTAFEWRRERRFRAFVHAHVCIGGATLVGRSQGGRFDHHANTS